MCRSCCRWGQSRFYLPADPGTACGSCSAGNSSSGVSPGGHKTWDWDLHPNPKPAQGSIGKHSPCTPTPNQPRYSLESTVPAPQPQTSSGVHWGAQNMGLRPSPQPQTSPGVPWATHETETPQSQTSPGSGVSQQRRIVCSPMPMLFLCFCPIIPIILLGSFAFWNFLSSSGRLTEGSSSGMGNPNPAQQKWEIPDCHWV